MTPMTDSRAVEVLAAMFQHCANNRQMVEADALNHAIARLREPAGVDGEWVLALVEAAEAATEQVLHDGMSSRAACDRLIAATASARTMLAAAPRPPCDMGDLCIQCPEAAPQPPAEAQAQGGAPAWPVWVRDEALEVLRNVDAQFRATGQKSARIERLINLIAGLPDPAPPSAPTLKVRDAEARAQGGGERRPEPNWCPTCDRRPRDPMAALCTDAFHNARTAPPSAPVGVEGLHARADEIERAIVTDGMGAMAVFTQMRQLLPSRAAQQPAAPTWIGIDWAEGQQPAAVDGAMVERAREAYYDAAEVKDGVFTDPVAMRAALTAAIAAQQGGSNHDQ